MRSRVQLALWCLVAGALLAPGALQAQSSNTVPSIELQTTIDPASAKWISSALDDAADDGAPLAIIRIDTPGGLDESMREIVKDIIDAPMPVVVYVSPDGARAASAGAFITQAGDVAAMAPQTNIGAASAVTATGGDIGGTLGEKVENDAAAYIRALAESHGRDGALPARMVTDAESVTASEALDQRAIDVIAASEDELLTELDGIRVKGPKATTLHTAGLEISERDTPLQYELLSLLVNPTVAYLLLLVGLVGLGIEVFSPGLIFPGTLGLVSLLLGAYGTAQLPVTAAGIALLVVSLLLGGALAFAVQKVVAARHRPVMTGWEEMVGAIGEVRQPLVPAGQVFVDGALWRAVPAEGAPAGEVERVSRRGARVRVEAVEGLTLRVRPLEREAEPVEGAS